MMQRGLIDFATDNVLLFLLESATNCSVSFSLDAIPYHPQQKTQWFYELIELLQGKRNLIRHRMGCFQV